MIPPNAAGPVCIVATNPDTQSATLPNAPAMRARPLAVLGPVDAIDNCRLP